MADFDLNLRDIYRILRRRRWVILLSTLLVGALTFLVAERPPDLYLAESEVKVSRVASNMQALLVEALSWYQGDNIETQSRIIESQRIQVRVARQLAKIGYPDFEQIPSNLSTDEILDDAPLMRMVSQVEIQADRKGDSDIIGIEVVADSEQLAVDTANLAAVEFIQLNREERNRQVNEAVNFITTRIRQTESELEAAESILQEFKRRNAGVLGLDLSASLQLERERESLDRKIAGLERAIDQLERMSAPEDFYGYSPAVVDSRDPLIVRLEEELADMLVTLEELEAERRRLLAYQIETAPQVQQATEKLQELEARFMEKVHSLSQRYQMIQNELSSQRDSVLRRSGQLDSLPEVTRQMQALSREVEQKSEALTELTKQLENARIQQASEIQEISLVEEATEAVPVDTTSRELLALVGMLLGLLLGGVFAFVLESLDTSIGTIEDVERHLGLPVLGVVPHLDMEAMARHVPVAEMENAGEEDLENIAILCAHFAPREPVSESFRSLRTHVEAVMEKEHLKTLAVTSSVLQEGKTSAASNLAVVFAQSGKRTLLIDADLRRPRANKIFGLSRAPGLTDVLLGVVDWETTLKSIDDLILGKFGLKAAHRTPGLEYLFVMTAGSRVDSPSELLSMQKFSSLMASASEHFDVVIVDVAPILPVADASVVAPLADGILLAYQIGRIGRDVVNRSKTRLEGLGANVVGLIMNDIEAEIDYTQEYQHYSYRYQYDENFTDRPGFIGRAGQKIRNLFTRGRGKERARHAKIEDKTNPVNREKPRAEKAGEEKPEPARNPARDSAPDRQLADIMGLTDDKGDRNT